MKNIFLQWSEKLLYNHRENENFNWINSVIWIWWSYTMPSILLPSYILWWIETLSNWTSDRLKIFIASNLSALLNGFSSSQSCDIWNVTKIFLEQFVQEFYSEFANRISIEVDDVSKAETTIDYSNVFLRLHWWELISSLSEEEKTIIATKNKKYRHTSEDSIQTSDLLYAVCHPSYESMYDHHVSIIKIWWRVEALFNSISTHILNIEKPKNTIIQRITKSWKSPLYYAMNWEPLLWNEYDWVFEEIKRSAPMRQFDCEILAERIGEEKYLEFYNDTIASTSFTL